MPELAVMSTFLIVVVLIIFILAVIVSNIKIVPQAHAFVVERLGAVSRQLGDGSSREDPLPGPDRQKGVLEGAGH